MAAEQIHLEKFQIINQFKWLLKKKVTALKVR